MGQQGVAVCSVAMAGWDGQWAVAAMAGAAADPPGEGWLAEGLPASWILHSSPGLLVLNKPAGLLSQPGLGPQQADALITRVRRRWPQAQLVHRLDRDTSGLLLVALEPALHRALSIAFAERRVEKHYVADVVGVPTGVEGRIDWPLAKCQHRPPRYGVDPERGKPCSTDWRLLEADGPGPGSGDGSGCRLALQPRTGRSHQLRVHLQALGHPIVGDPLYGPVGPAQRMHLHASVLAFVHPHSGERVCVASPVPFARPSLTPHA
jgi:tRNA pseudouridine32 synthase/23S rRNA pseudouridine746 synthase